MTRLAVHFVTSYQQFVSPLLGSQCRFAPPCSEYARLVLQSHGLFRGGWLAMSRIARCHPFHPGGVDYPPPSYRRPA